jgi:hypothetical protein
MAIQTVRTENFPRIFPRKKISKKEAPSLPVQVPLSGGLKGKLFREDI